MQRSHSIVSFITPNRDIAGLRWSLRCWGLLFITILAIDAQAQWLRAESEHVVVYSDSDERRVRAFVQKLERFHALLEYRLPGRTPDLFAKLAVYLVRDRGDLRYVFPRGGPALAGVYLALPSGVQAVAIADRPDRRDADDVLLHEYTHHFMNLRYPQGGPLWLTEGFAEYFATADVEGKRITVGEPSRIRAFELVTNYDNWINYGDILTGAAFRGNAQARSLAYAQSWLLTHYLLRTNERWAAVQDVLASSRGGGSIVDAFEKHLGFDMVDLRQELRQYASNQIRFTVLDIEFAEAPVQVTPMTAATSKMMLPNITFVLGQQSSDALTALRDGLARFPTDEFALASVARAETAMGDPQRALELLAPLLATGNASADSHYLAGMAQRAIADRLAVAPSPDERAVSAARVAAANHFARAIRADETDYRSLYRYWQIRAENGDAQDIRQQDVLVHAYNLAPQVQEIALAAGMMMLRVNRILEAHVVLNKLAGDPHGEQFSTTAARLLALIDGLPPGRGPTEAELRAALAAPPDASTTSVAKPE